MVRSKPDARSHTSARTMSAGGALRAGARRALAVHARVRKCAICSVLAHQPAPIVQVQPRR